MNKFKKTVLLLSLVLFGACCYAFCIAGTEDEKKEGIPIVLKEASSVSEPSKGNSIIPIIDGHVLSLIFNENIGQVDVEIATASGVSIQYDSVITPDGLQIYIANTGDYIVTFMLSNGDQYYGEFTVID